MTFYENEYVTIKYFEKEKLVFTTYHGFVPSDELRKILDVSLDLISTKNVELGLADNRKMKVIRPADQEYINNVWFPKFLKLSRIIKSASVESTDIFNKMSVDNMLKKISGLIEFQIGFFDSVEKACEWLEIDPKILSK